jgi:hypothetical protein
MPNIPISIAIFLQLLMFSKFLHESIYTDLGTRCRVKCGLAAAGYFFMAAVLSYGLIFFHP